MPGSSLWLVPPKASGIEAALQKLISVAVPSLFADLCPPDFAPHVTLTSDIDPAVYGEDPQAWLDAINLSGKPARVRFLAVDTERPFYRKCSLRVDKTVGGLDLIAGECRRVGVLGGDGKAALEWAGLEYRPHCSLMYADTTVSEEQLSLVEEAVVQAGIRLHGGLGPSSPSQQTPFDGWEGGDVWLVPTDKAIDEWRPIATRTLKPV